MPIAREITGGTANVYDLVLFVAGAPTANELVLRHVVVRPLTLPPNLAGSQARAGTPASGSPAFALAVNGAPVGSITFAASGTGTLPTSDAAQLVPGDVLTLTAPAVADAALADLSFTLALIR